MASKIYILFWLVKDALLSQNNWPKFLIKHQCEIRWTGNYQLWISSYAFRSPGAGRGEIIVR